MNTEQFQVGASTFDTEMSSAEAQGEAPSTSPTFNRIGARLGLPSGESSHDTAKRHSYNGTGSSKELVLPKLTSKSVSSGQKTAYLPTTTSSRPREHGDLLAPRPIRKSDSREMLNADYSEGFPPLQHPPRLAAGHPSGQTPRSQSRTEETVVAKASLQSARSQAKTEHTSSSQEHLPLASLASSSNSTAIHKSSSTVRLSARAHNLATTSFQPGHHRSGSYNDSARSRSDSLDVPESAMARRASLPNDALSMPGLPSSRTTELSQAALRLHNEEHSNTMHASHRIPDARTSGLTPSSSMSLGDLSQLPRIKFARKEEAEEESGDSSASDEEDHAILEQLPSSAKKSTSPASLRRFKSSPGSKYAKVSDLILALTSQMAHLSFASPLARSDTNEY